MKLPKEKITALYRGNKYRNMLTHADASPCLKPSHPISKKTPLLAIGFRPHHCTSITASTPLESGWLSNYPKKKSAQILWLKPWDPAFSCWYLQEKNNNMEPKYFEDASLFQLDKYFLFFPNSVFLHFGSSFPDNLTSSHHPAAMRPQASKKSPTSRGSNWTDRPNGLQLRHLGFPYCWWFRNPIPNHLGCIQPCK